MHFARSAAAGAVLAFAIVADSAPGAVTVYLNESAWGQAAGAHTELTFTDLPFNTLVTDQYSHLGISFTDGDDTIFGGGYWEDGKGLIGDIGMFGYDKPINIIFDAPRNSFAVLYLAGARIRLYAGETLVGDSAYWDRSATGPFLGVISSVAFDRVLYDAGGVTTAAADSVFFGQAIPSPGGLLLLGAGALGIGRRRRSPS